MGPEEQQRIELWRKEWKLAGVGYVSSMYGPNYADVQISADGMKWLIRIFFMDQYPMKTWAVCEPHRNLAKYGSFFCTLDEALEAASEKVRALL